MEKRTVTVFSLFSVHEETNTSTKVSSSWISIDVGSALGFGMGGEFSISLPILELGTYIKKKQFNGKCSNHDYYPYYWFNFFC